MAIRVQCLTVALIVICSIRAGSAKAPPTEDERLANGLVFPYVTSGGSPDGMHIQTLLFLSNPRAIANGGTIEFFDNRGGPWPVLLVGNSKVAARAMWTTPPEATRMLVAAHPSEAVQTGWVKITTFEKSPIRLIAVLQLYNGEDLVKESMLVFDPAEKRYLPYQMTSLRDDGSPWTAPRRRGAAVIPAAFLQGVPGPPAGAMGTKRTAPKVCPQVDRASWYGQAFHGRTTASGEVYDQRHFTAAHRSLPFGTRAKVTNLRNGRSVWVRITDRGPYKPGRIVDLSRAAADELGLLGHGIAPVLLEAALPDHQPRV
jgi:hypothetical protein